MGRVSGKRIASIWAYARKLFPSYEKQVFLNPGSVCTPLGIGKYPETRYALLEINDGIIQVTHRSFSYPVEPIWQDFINYGCYDVNPYLSRLIMEMLYTGEYTNLIGDFFRLAKNIMKRNNTDVFNMPPYPHGIWKKTAECFPWRLENKFIKA